MEEIAGRTRLSSKQKSNAGKHTLGRRRKSIRKSSPELLPGFDSPKSDLCLETAKVPSEPLNKLQKESLTNATSVVDFEDKSCISDEDFIGDIGNSLSKRQKINKRINTKQKKKSSVSKTNSCNEDEMVVSPVHSVYNKGTCNIQNREREYIQPNETLSPEVRKINALTSTPSIEDTGFSDKCIFNLEFLNSQNKSKINNLSQTPKRGSDLLLPSPMNTVGDSSERNLRSNSLFDSGFSSNFNSVQLTTPKTSITLGTSPNLSFSQDSSDNDMDEILDNIVIKLTKDNDIVKAPSNNAVSLSYKTSNVITNIGQNLEQNSTNNIDKVSTPFQDILKGINAFIDVKSNGRNCSSAVASQLKKMGASVSKTMNSKVTHVIFKEGRKSIWKEAKAKDIPLVSIAWIEKCKESMCKAPEDLFPPIRAEEYSSENFVHLPLPLSKSAEKKSKKFFQEYVKRQQALRSSIGNNPKIPAKVSSEPSQALNSVKDADTSQNNSDTAQNAVSRTRCPDSSKTSTNGTENFIENHIMTKLLEQDSKNLSSKTRRRTRFNISTASHDPVLKSHSWNRTRRYMCESSDSDTSSFSVSPVQSPKKKFGDKASCVQKQVIDANVLTEVMDIANRTCKEVSTEFSHQISKENDSLTVSHPKPGENSSKAIKQVIGSTSLTLEQDSKENNLNIESDPKSAKQTSKRKDRKSLKEVVQVLNNAAGSASMELANICHVDDSSTVKQTPKFKKQTSKARYSNPPQKKTAAVNGSIESFLKESSCQNTNKLTPIVSAKSLTKKHKVLNNLVFTNVPPSDREVLCSVVTSLGGFTISGTVRDMTTHVVCGEKKRTINLLLALVRGLWVLSPLWIFKSLDAGYWLEEEQFELPDYFPALKASRLERAASGPFYRQNLFGHLGAFFVSSDTQPSKDILVELITLAGGKISSSIRRCSVAVGTAQHVQPNSVSCMFVPEKWILDCISDHKILPLT